MRVWKALAVVTIAGVTLAGCASVNQQPGAGMMRGTSGGSPGMMGGFGAGMMGSVPDGYSLSRLSCPAPTSMSGTTVYVMVGDMGRTRAMGGTAPLGQHMMLRAVPAQVHAGRVNLVVGNMGWRTHELVVLPLARGQVAGRRTPGPDGKVDESGSRGEASATCAAGSGEGIEAGSVGWVTVNLPAGRYELVCNLANHYANGMRQLLLVTR